MGETCAIFRLKLQISCEVISCRLVHGYHHFGKVDFLHLNVQELQACPLRAIPEDINFGNTSVKIWNLVAFKMFIGNLNGKLGHLMQMWNVQDIHNRTVRVQKLTRNLFLTLHGHNVHHQQQQLPKFLMRYQQFASHAYCGAAGPVSKMTSQQGKAFCVLRFEVSRSLITVQREFRARFRKEAPARCMRNLDSCCCWRCTLCPRKVRNRFLVNFWNHNILLCIPCILKKQGVKLSAAFFVGFCELGNEPSGYVQGVNISDLQHDDNSWRRIWLFCVI